MKTNKMEFERLEDNSFVFRFSVTKEEVAKEYQHALKHAQEHFEAKGFRKGKAPLNVVEQSIPQSALLEETASHVLSHNYEERVKANNLHPIIQPEVKILNPPITMEGGWDVEIKGCELPKYELDKKCYDSVKKINTTKEEKEDKNATLDKIVEELIKHSKVKLPQILVNADLDHRLSSLVEQINQAGITIEQFLKNKKQTIEEYKEELKGQITKEWTLNLAIDAIFKEQKMEITPEEGKALLEKNPQLAENINLVFYLLSQQKVFEYLQSLK